MLAMLSRSASLSSYSNIESDIINVQITNNVHSRPYPKSCEGKLKRNAGSLAERRRKVEPCTQCVCTFLHILQSVPPLSPFPARNRCHYPKTESDNVFPCRKNFISRSVAPLYFAALFTASLKMRNRFFLLSSDSVVFFKESSP